MVLTCNDYRINPRKLVKFQGIVSVSTFGFLVGSRNFIKFFCVSWEDFVCTGMIVSTVWPSLVPPRHVPRFTFFTENFVICSNQITIMFRSGHDCTSASSARSPCYFRLFVSFGKCVYTLCLPEPSSTFSRGSIGDS